MNNIKISSVNFNGAYVVKSENPEIVMEICERFKSMLKKSPEKDFVDFRVRESATDRTKSLLDYVYNNSEYENQPRNFAAEFPYDIFEENETVTGGIIPVKLKRTSHSVSNSDNSNLDLILTGDTHRNITGHITEIVTSTLDLRYVTIGLKEKLKIIIDELLRVKTAIEEKRPVRSLNPVVIENHMRPIRYKDLQVQNAQTVLEALKGNRFNIQEGLVTT